MFVAMHAVSPIAIANLTIVNGPDVITQTEVHPGEQ